MTSGSQAVFPGTARNLLLSLGGVIQEPDTSFTISGSTLTFTTAPVANTTFFAVIFGDMQSTGTPSDGTVLPASIASSGNFSFPQLTVTGTSSLGDDVTFTGANYNVVWDKSDNALEFADNAKAIFGTGSDLQIYHDGSNSYISEGGTGSLIIDAPNTIFQDGKKVVVGTGSDVQLYHDGTNSYLQNLTNNFRIESDALRLRSYTGGENFIVANVNGSVELYYDAVKQCETVSTGLNFADNKIASFGTSSDLQIYHASNIDKIESNGAGMHIRQINNGDVHIHAGADSSASNNRLVARSAGAAELYHSGTKKLETTSTGVLVTGKVETTGLTRDGDITFERSGNTRLTVDNGGITVGGDIKYNDNYKIKVGTGADLEIYHNGTHSFIENSTGILAIRSDSFQITDKSNNHAMITATADGSAELYYDNSKKFETISAGAKVLGDFLFRNTSDATQMFFDASESKLQVYDNSKITFGNTDDLEIYHSSSNAASYIQNSTGNLFIEAPASAAVKLRKKGTTEAMIVAAADGAVELYYDNVKKFETNSDGGQIFSTLEIGNTAAPFLVESTTSGNGLEDIGRVGINRTNSSTSDRQMWLQFTVGASASQAAFQARSANDTGTAGTFLKIDAVNNNVDLPRDNEKLQLGAGNDIQIHHNGSNSFITNSTGGLYIRSDLLGLEDKTNGHSYLGAQADGAVTLRYDNSVKFATTSAGVSVTGKATFPDGNSNGVFIGDGSDLRIFHNGSHSYVENVTGNLNLTSSQSVVLKTNNTEDSIVCNVNGSTDLYHNGNIQVFTIDGGMNWQDNKKAEFGNSGDLKIYHDGTDNRFDSNGLKNMIFRPKDTDVGLKIIGDGSVELYYDGVKKLNTSSGGIEIAGTVYFGQGHAVNVMNRESDGTLLEFKTTGTARGSISVSGNTVSYNGGHLSRWSQIKGLSSTDKSARPTIYKGTVMSNLDDLCVWKDKEPEQLNMTKISDTEGDKDVAGVFWAWDEDNTVEVNDFYVSMTGDMVIRVAASITVARGDLLISAGDGTAKPQADDIVRSSTIAKITSTTSTATYADGSKAYPCVLMAC